MCLKRIHFNPAQISANLAKLESDFIAKGGKWEKFRLGDLFDIDNTWIYGKNKQYKTRSQMPLLNSIPVISGITINNGVCYYTNDNLRSDEIFSHDLTISTRGEYSGTVTYHDENFALANNILVMQLPKHWNKLHKLYLATLISKLGYGGYSGYPKKETLKQDFIILPIDKNRQIAFDFMESFIKELELERIKELEAYLQATGLNNYELTDKEKQTLNIFANSNSTQSLEWQEFRIEDLFSVKSNPQLNKDSFTFRENGQYPYFTRTVLNNGISGYVDYLDEAHKIKGGGLAVGMLGMQFFYMEKDFYAGQFTKTCYPKFENFNKQIAYFFIAWLNKNQKVFQGVLVRDFEKVFNDTKIKLPTDKNGQIDFDFMESFISAVQKEVIKSVNLWSEKRINTTKEVIQKHA